MKGAALGLVLLLGGCAGGGTAQVPAGDESTSVEPEVFVEADRIRMTVPAARRGEVAVPAPGTAGPWEIAVGSFRVRAREILPEVTFAGEDLLVFADGIVKVRRTSGRMTTEEGPFRTAVFRNGRMLAR